jgi:pimeloyl-ACP methyl ester carboxylesterase
VRIAVLVPGFMGSALHERGQELWSANFLVNYARLLDDPEFLEWSPGQEPASATLIEDFCVSKRLPWLRKKIWNRLLGFLEADAEFGAPGRILKAGYDWRQSVLDTASDLSDAIDTHIASSPGGDVESPELTFIAHSMGGLVVRCAIAGGLIAPERVDRLIQIGSPLEGSAEAFDGAYRSGRLPFLRELTTLVRWRNAHQFFESLLRSIQTFPSSYQLMPPAGDNFLYFPPTRRENPFDNRFPSSIPSSLRATAVAAHTALQGAEGVIAANGIASHTVYSDWNQASVDLVYHVMTTAGSAPGYRILDVEDETREGDGTVAAASASGSSATSRQWPLKNVDHAYMCHEKKVVEYLRTILDEPR